MDVEYRLPGSGSWCDAVLLGRGSDRPAGVIVELKDWDTSGDAPGPRETLVTHEGRLSLHPSDQVRGYAEYARHFHSAVQAQSADIHGCVFFTRATEARAYSRPPHDRLVAEYPLFTSGTRSRDVLFPEFLGARLHQPDFPFARQFEHGTYRQDRSFVDSIARAMLDADIPQLVLLDEQRRGLALCRQVIDEAAQRVRAGSKEIVIVDGPPGSGKSAIAARLWAELIRDRVVDGNVVFVTTSGSQRSNWETIFRRARRRKSAAGVTWGANQYNPGLSVPWIARERGQGHALRAGDWRSNLLHFERSGRESRVPDDLHAVSIVDEAHSLIDPVKPGLEGIPPSGWTIHAGPQAWHIIRASRVSVFLMDGDQSYRDNESTTIADLERYATELGAKLTRVSLSGMQFRCGGSRGYVEWVDRLLGLDPAELAAAPGRSDWEGRFDLKLARDPFELEAGLRAQAAAGRSVRLLASYARPWRTKGIAAPHQLPPEEQDFSIRIDGDPPRVWNRIWNFAPRQNYAHYIQALPGSAMHADPLCEVGCPYVVRGFDWDYVGLLWLSDLVWRRDRWRVQLEHVHESAWPKTVRQARLAMSFGGIPSALLERLARGYRILLTRALRGIHIWVEDEETRQHLAGLLAP